MGVYKKHNRWYIDYYLPDGNRKREVVTIEGISPDQISRQDALKALTIRRAEIATGKFDITQTQTKFVSFEKLVNAFIEDYSKANKKSWTRDVTSCNALIGFFGGRKLTHITPWTVDKYKSKRIKDSSRFNRPLAQATINRVLACLKTMLNFAVKENWLSKNPLSGYKLFREKQNKLRVVSPEEFYRVYENASKFLKPILVTAYNSGMRGGEILYLKWENVDFERGYIRVEETKNNEARKIPINKKLKEALESVKYEASGDYVFTREGKPIGSFKTAFKAAIKRAGVERFTFHNLRHTFASNLVMSGVDLATVQELLGHKSILMTKRYSHPTPEHKKQAVEKLDIIDTYLDTMVTSIQGNEKLTT